MKLTILRNEEYATALKEALKMRREGTIDRATDDQLGLFAYNIAQWAIAASVQKKQLYRSMSGDIDFQSDVLAVVVSYLDKVDLDRQPKEILVYLYRVARSAIRDLVDKATAGKRQHEEVDFDGYVLTTDFYGRPNGATFDGEKISPKQTDINFQRRAIYELSR